MEEPGIYEKAREIVAYAMREREGIVKIKSGGIWTLTQYNHITGGREREFDVFVLCYVNVGLFVDCISRHMWATLSL